MRIPPALTAEEWRVAVVITRGDLHDLHETAANLRAFVESGRAGDFLRSGLLAYCDGAERLEAKLIALLPPAG